MPFGPKCIFKNPWYPIWLARSKPRLFWEFVGLLLMIFEALATPYRLSFGAVPKGHWWNMEVFVLTYFGADFVSQFFLSINMDDSNVPDIMKPGLIIKRYLKTWFFLDLLATFPFGLVFGAFESLRALRMFRFVRYLRMLKLFRILKLQNKLLLLEQSLEGFGWLLALVKILKVLILLVFLSHFTACIWYMVGTLGLPDDVPQSCKDEPWTCEDDNITWLTSGVAIDEGLDEDDIIFQLYINTAYFVLQAMTCVGYGDMGPRTVKEEAYLVVFFAFAVSIFGSVIGSLQEVMEDLFRESIKYREVRKKVVRWMRFRNFPYDLKQKMKRYVEFIFDHDEVTGKRPMQKDAVEKVYNGLSPGLRRQVKAKVYLLHLDRVPYLSWIQPYEMAYISLASECWANQYAPGDPVISANQCAQNFFALMDGSLMLFSVMDDEQKAHLTYAHMTMYCQGSVFDFAHQAVLLKKRKAMMKGDEKKRFPFERKGPNHLLEEIHERLRANLPKSEHAALASAPEIFGQEALLHINKEKNWEIPSWHWPYSAWCASFCDLLQMPLEGVKKTLDRFPFLWPLYEDFRRKEVADLRAGRSEKQAGCGKDFLTTLKQPQAKVKQNSNLPFGDTSKLVGTWTYLNASREYTITKVGDALQWMQVDIGTGRAVNGILKPIDKDGEVWQAELSNMGLIQVRHFWDPMGEGSRQDERLATRYAIPGSRHFPSKEVIACRHINEVAEIKDIDRSNHIYSEMRSLQVKMSRIIDRYSTLSVLNEKCRIEGSVLAAQMAHVDFQDPSNMMKQMETRATPADAAATTAAGGLPPGAMREDDEQLQIEKVKFMKTLKGMAMGDEIVEQMWRAKKQEIILQKSSPPSPAGRQAPPRSSNAQTLTRASTRSLGKK
eukprot:gnl/MRDRNA2_/MRDRNA2_76981_c0_seq1.p1 gnl/MRDRNA2_/MRDRNA2_76981_c0~~gnl/MRDRNA2_/MRDRNA2_76981_c0_seq1.p1  ORF type:complete len:962 (-),score=174.19 gnl/MRDRNA2_/MRDRNA2_76981_c0_seq1:232-2898(-)